MHLRPLTCNAKPGFVSGDNACNWEMTASDESKGIKYKTIVTLSTLSPQTNDISWLAPSGPQALDDGLGQPLLSSSPNWDPFL